MSGINNHDGEDLERGPSVPALFLSLTHGSMDSGSLYASRYLLSKTSSEVCMDVTISPKERSASTSSQKKTTWARASLPLQGLSFIIVTRYEIRCTLLESPEFMIANGRVPVSMEGSADLQS